MGKKDPAVVEQPDPFEIARADADFNRIDQITPYGNLTYSGPNRNTATLSLSPELQRVFDQRMGVDSAMMDQAGNLLANYDPSSIDLSQYGPIQSNIDRSGINFSGVDTSGLPNPSLPQLSGFQGQLPALMGAATYQPSQMDIQGGVAGTDIPRFDGFTDVQRSIDSVDMPLFGGFTNVQGALDFSGLQDLPVVNNELRSNVEDAYFQRARRLLEPQFQRQEDSLRQTLANQGLPGTSDAFLDQFDQFNTNRGNTFANVADQAVLAGGQEVSRMLADALGARRQQAGEITTQGQFANNAAGQLFGQNLAGYNANMNTLQNQFNQGLLQGQFANDAAAQLFGQGLAGYNANFNAANAEFGQNLAQGQFANAAAAQDQGRSLQDFQAGMTQAGFNNQTMQQALANILSTTEFNNLVGQQGFGNEAALRSQLFGENLAASQSGNQAAQMEAGLRQQMLANQNAGRAMGLNEALQLSGNDFNRLASFLGLQQVQPAQMQNFFAPGQVDMTGAYQLAQNANMFNAQQQNQMSAAAMQGLYGLGSAGIIGGMGAWGQHLGNPSASDRRLKRNIKRIGTVRGYPWYSFEYVWGQKAEGFMSDEVPQQYVTKDRYGFDAVYYGPILAGV